LNSSYLSFNLF